MMNTETIIPVALREFGCFVHVKDGALWAAPMCVDGSIEMDGGEPNWCDVTDPPNQKYLNAVNEIYGTKFIMKDFGFPARYDVYDARTYYLIPEVHGSQAPVDNDYHS